VGNRKNACTHDTKIPRTLGASRPHAMTRRIKKLSVVSSRKRIARLRKMGYEIPLVPTAQGMLVLRRKPRRTKHGKTR